MTENELRINGKSFSETITQLEEFMESDNVHGELFTVLRSARDFMENLNEEIQQYRAIGTVEEIKALKEKSVAKKSTEFHESEVCIDFICPNCKEAVYGQPYKPNYCKHCGQKLDWSE